MTIEMKLIKSSVVQIYTRDRFYRVKKHLKRQDLFIEVWSYMNMGVLIDL